MFGRGQGLGQRLERMEAKVEGQEALLQRIEAALVVRDPGNARSVEAYDGLRKQVAAASSDRRRMLVQLIELHDRLAAGSSVADMESLVDEWVVQSGLVRLAHADPIEAFEVVGDGLGEPRVVRPAWFDGGTGALLRRGMAEATGAVEDGAANAESRSAGADADEMLVPNTASDLRGSTDDGGADEDTNARQEEPS